jgi:Zinc knuckle
MARDASERLRDMGREPDQDQEDDVVSEQPDRPPTQVRMAGDASERPRDRDEIDQEDNAASEQPDRRQTLNFGDTFPAEIGFEEFVQKFHENPREIFDRLLKITWDLKEETIAAIQRKDDYKERLKKKETQIQSLVEERDDYQAAFARLSLRREGNSRHSSSHPETPMKSIKLPDPPIFTDGKDPKFEDWQSRMKIKLKANSDHYTTEELRMAYVGGRVGGKASDHLNPRLRDDSPNRYRTADEMFKHLETIYLDPNRVVNAKREFRIMQMRPNEKYQDFLTRFLGMAAEAKVPEIDYKDELYNKLTFKLQELTASGWINDQPFSDFSTYCSKIANGIQMAREKRDWMTRKETSPNRRMAPGLARTQNIADPTLNFDKSGRVDRTKYMREGRCYNCHETGHIAKDCTYRKQRAELKAMEENKIETRELAKDQP